MDEFLSSELNDSRSQFPAFLEFYVDSIYPKRKLFAKDIDVNPTSLSQVINSHREPKEEFILRLIIHSEEVGDRLLGIIGGYIRWSGMIDDPSQAIIITENIGGRQLDTWARELILGVHNLR